MARKTKLMQRVEKEFSRPLENLLPEKVNEVGLSATAEELGVSKATLGYWLLKLGINVRRVALAPGETLEVKRISYNLNSPYSQTKKEKARVFVAKTRAVSFN